MITTWRLAIELEMKANKDNFANMVSLAISDGHSLDTKFDAGYGGSEGCAFTLWTNDRVYFPVCYDGSEWCGSVSRNPNGIPTEHVGGG